jgi:hypothetical protein
MGQVASGHLGAEHPVKVQIIYALGQSDSVTIRCEVPSETVKGYPIIFKLSNDEVLQLCMDLLKAVKGNTASTGSKDDE